MVNFFYVSNINVIQEPRKEKDLDSADYMKINYELERLGKNFRVGPAMAEQNRGGDILVILHALNQAGLYSSDESKKNSNLEVTLDEVL